MSAIYSTPADLRAAANAAPGRAAPAKRAAVGRKTRRFTIKPNSQPQYDFVSDMETYLVAGVGGIGSGKSTGLAFFIVMKMSTEAGRGTIGGIFANTYRQLEQSTLPALWDLFEKMGLREGVDYVYNREPPKSWDGYRSAFKRHAGVLTVRRWGQCVVRSLENFNSIRGLTLGWAAIDELRDARHEAFLVVIGRVRCPKCSRLVIRIATSPNGFNWIYDELVVKAGKNRRVVRMPTWCNPDLPDEYKVALTESFDERFSKQELDGIFVSVTVGAVYHAFDRDRHVDQTIAADPVLPFKTFWDFNRVPFCVEIGQAQPTPTGERLVIIDEVVGVDVGTEEMCEKVAARVRELALGPHDPGSPGDMGPAVVEVYGDPAGNQRKTAANNRSDYDAIQKYLTPLVGRLVPRWRRDVYPVVESVNAVNAILRRAGRFGIHPRCKKTILDFESVVWEKGTPNIDKSNDDLTHSSDGVRYGIAEMYPIRVRHAGRVQT